MPPKKDPNNPKLVAANNKTKTGVKAAIGGPGSAANRPPLNKGGSKKDDSLINDAAADNNDNDNENENDNDNNGDGGNGGDNELSELKAALSRAEQENNRLTTLVNSKEVMIDQLKRHLTKQSLESTSATTTITTTSSPSPSPSASGSGSASSSSLSLSSLSPSSTQLALLVLQQRIRFLQKLLKDKEPQNRSDKDINTTDI